MADDNDIHAGLRELVDEGGPAASDEALHEVMRRGRRKRTNKRLGAVAAVVVAVTGIGVAAAMVPTLAAGPEPIVPANPSVQETSRPQRTSVPPSTKSQQAQPSKTTTPESQRPAACSHLPLPPGGWNVRRGECPYGPWTGGFEANFAETVRVALPEATVTGQGGQGRFGNIFSVQVTGQTFSGRVVLQVFHYEPKSWQQAVAPDNPVIIPGAKQATIVPSVPGPEAWIFFADGRLYLLRTGGGGSDTLPAEQLTAIAGQLAEGG